MPIKILRIVSGGQTGVDRAALEVALALDLPTGGWCPKGRIAEDGIIAARYPLLETRTADYYERTRKNVEDSDGSLILLDGPISGGTAYTKDCAVSLKRPHLVLDVNDEVTQKHFWDWVNKHDIKTLNIAGPRESKCPGIYERAKLLLNTLLR